MLLKMKLKQLEWTKVEKPWGKQLEGRIDGMLFFTVYKNNDSDVIGDIVLNSKILFQKNRLHGAESVSEGKEMAQKLLKKFIKMIMEE